MEMPQLTTTTSSSSVKYLKTFFAKFGIPTKLVTDNGPQLISQEMKEFAQSYDFQYIITSL